MIDSRNSWLWSSLDIPLGGISLYARLSMMSHFLKLLKAPGKSLAADPLSTCPNRNGVERWSRMKIGCMAGLDIFFFSFISCGSMNPARALAPAMLSGTMDDCSCTSLRPL